ncbi:hypothetical protein GCM10009127_04300 [Alteraurantiacibacter aestuarii]|uniref:Uncharacterized protein n=1 Tax=Alteraurantiacibacter aestuarii TaxID=650004 RepID=A0A844ZMQ0_9SPHN|nr:hypothetical protein [Alteraurantiacibacter aestuarii]MXO88320.1 hypothetical protein [Alteraurantiacibacter aestuarii]
MIPKTIAAAALAALAIAGTSTAGLAQDSSHDSTHHDAEAAHAKEAAAGISGAGEQAGNADKTVNTAERVDDPQAVAAKRAQAEAQGADTRGASANTKG